MILNPYSPASEGETASELWFERSLFDGQHLESVAYGVHLSVFAVTMYYHLVSPLRGRRSWFFIVYLSLLFVAGTINAGAGIRFAEMAWIDDRDFPGGPAAFNVQMYNSFVEVIGNCGYVIADFLADGLLFWRVFVLYNRSIFVSLIPGLAYLTSIALGCLSIFQAAQPTASIWSHSATQIAIPYFCLSLATNALLSTLIAARLIWHRNSLRKTLGSEYSEMYTSIAAMFIESSALYAVVGIFFVICFARGSNIQNLLLGVLGQIECIGPELILLKVARGRSWTSRSFTNAVSTDMNFGPSRERKDRFVHTSRTFQLSHGQTEISKLENEIDLGEIEGIGGESTTKINSGDSRSLDLVVQ